MSPTKRRCVGSVLFALFSVYLTLGGSDTDGWDLSDATAAMFGFVLVGFMVFRAWPALEMVWDGRRLSSGRHPLEPTWPRAVGAVGIGLFSVLLMYLGERLVSSSVEVNAWGIVHDLFVFSVIGYFIWPGVSAWLLRLRAH